MRSLLLGRRLVGSYSKQHQFMGLVFVHGSSPYRIELIEYSNCQQVRVSQYNQGEESSSELTNSATSFDDPVVLNQSPPSHIFSSIADNSPFKDNL